MSNQRSIRNEALALDPLERAALIEDLLSSFDSGTRSAVDMAWTKEAVSRAEAYDRGDLQAISLEDSKRRIRNG